MFFIKGKSIWVLAFESARYLKRTFLLKCRARPDGAVLQFSDRQCSLARVPDLISSIFVVYFTPDEQVLFGLGARPGKPARIHESSPHPSPRPRPCPLLHQRITDFSEKIIIYLKYYTFWHCRRGYLLQNLLPIIDKC